MRILYVVPRYYPATGGAELWSRALIQRMAQRHTVAVVSQWRTNARDYLAATTWDAPSVAAVDDDNGIPVHTLSPQGRERDWLAHLGRLYARSRAVRPLFYSIYRRALLPQLIELAGGYDIIHLSHIGLVYTDEVTLECARTLRIPLVFTPFPHAGGWEGRRFRRLYRHANAIAAMTEVEKTWLVARGARQERVHVVRGGPLLTEQGNGLEFRRRLEIHGPIVLFVGQRLRHKGYQALLEAMPTIWETRPDVSFVFIGPMTEEASPAFTQAIHDRRVLDLGVVDLQTKTDALAACDMLCVPSTQESLGLVYLEAWAMGKPIIAGDIPVEREIVSNGVDGLLVTQESSAIAQAIEDLLSEPKRAQAMGQKGSEKVRLHYSWEAIVAHMELLYRSLVELARS